MYHSISDSGLFDHSSGPPLLGDNWDDEPDEDWYQLPLKANMEYEVYLEADSDVPVKHRLTRPRIVGIYDEQGVEVHHSAAGSGTDTSVSLTFQTTNLGRYYLAVGSNPGDREGLYSFYVQEVRTGNAGQRRPPTLSDRRARHHRLPRVGEVLTATTSGISDADGVETPASATSGCDTTGGQHRYGHPGRDRLHIHGNAGGPGPGHKGQGQLHRRRRQP